jgi:hypothetical protein
MKHLWKRLPCKVISGFAVVLLVGGCSDGIQAVAPLKSTLRTSITDELQEAVGENDLFALAQERPGEITAANAEQLAVAFWEDFKPWLSPTFQKERGATLHADALKSCGRPMYALSAYTSTPADASTTLKRAMGSHWIVGLCYGRTQELVISVSALATDVRLRATGRTRVENPGRGAFFAAAVPVGASVPPSPEAAVMQVAKLSRRLVTEVPRLAMLPFPVSPFSAVWELHVAGADGTLDPATAPPTVLFSGSLDDGGIRQGFAVSGQKPQVLSEGAVNTPLQKGVERNDAPKHLTVVNPGGVR